ncbi:MAG: hypothetical protein SFU25_02680 [Candidatus Caenarcaniphilales bacterium]|nr:hypothetical protein [Candidatus Caenarcaniphilales bacterium]
MTYNKKLFFEEFEGFPEEIKQKVVDFAYYLGSSKAKEETSLINVIQEITSKSQCFDFLNDEEELYTLEDAKEIYK